MVNFKDSVAVSPIKVRLELFWCRTFECKKESNGFEEMCKIHTESKMLKFIGKSKRKIWMEKFVWFARIHIQSQWNIRIPHTIACYTHKRCTKIQFGIKSFLHTKNEMFCKLVEIVFFRFGNFRLRTDFLLDFWTMDFCFSPIQTRWNLTKPKESSYQNALWPSATQFTT